MTVVKFPDKPTPVGCVIGFLALFPTAFSLLAFWAAYKAFSKEPPVPEIGKKLILSGALELIPALLGIAFFVFRLLTVGKRETITIGKSLSTGV